MTIKGGEKAKRVYAVFCLLVFALVLGENVVVCCGMVVKNGAVCDNETVLTYSTPSFGQFDQSGDYNSVTCFGSSSPSVTPTDFNNVSGNLYLNSFATQFFYNYNNYGRNNNSCGYVALTMLLSFYDTFLSENFIPNDFEVNTSIVTSTLNQAMSAAPLPFSPGVLDDGSTWSDLNDGDEFRSIVETGTFYTQAFNQAVCNVLDDFNSTTPKSLQFELIKIGVQNNSYGNTLNTFNYVSTLSLKNILEEYLYDTCGFGETQVCAEIATISDAAFSDDNDFYDYVIAKASNGIPVILFMQNDSGRVIL